MTRNAAMHVFHAARCPSHRLPQQAYSLLGWTEAAPYNDAVFRDHSVSAACSTVEVYDNLVVLGGSGVGAEERRGNGGGGAGLHDLSRDKGAK